MSFLIYTWQTSPILQDELQDHAERGQKSATTTLQTPVFAIEYHKNVAIASHPKNNS